MLIPICKSLPEKTVEYLEENLFIEDERATFGLDPESKEIAKKLFDSSKEHLGFWKHLQFFKFRKSRSDDLDFILYRMSTSVRPYTKNGSVNAHRVGLDNYTINDAMYVPHAY